MAMARFDSNMVVRGGSSDVDDVNMDDTMFNIWWVLRPTVECHTVEYIWGSRLRSRRPLLLPTLYRYRWQT